jgi:hypothetical protein
MIYMKYNKRKQDVAFSVGILLFWNCFVFLIIIVIKAKVINTGTYNALNFFSLISIEGLG